MLITIRPDGDPAPAVIKLIGRSTSNSLGVRGWYDTRDLPRYNGHCYVFTAVGHQSDDLGPGADIIFLKHMIPLILWQVSLLNVTDFKFGINVIFVAFNRDLRTRIKARARLCLVSQYLRVLPSLK